MQPPGGSTHIVVIVGRWRTKQKRITVTSSDPSVTMVMNHCAAESEATMSERLWSMSGVTPPDYWLKNFTKFGEKKLLSYWSTFCVSEFNRRQRQSDHISNLMLRPSVHVSAWDHVTCSWQIRWFQTSEWTKWETSIHPWCREKKRSTLTLNIFRLVRITLRFSMPGVAAPCWPCGSLQASASRFRRPVWCSGVPDGVLMGAEM